jgi:hypothetical protein
MYQTVSSPPILQNKKDLLDEVSHVSVGGPDNVEGVAVDYFGYENPDKACGQGSTHDGMGGLYKNDVEPNQSFTRLSAYLQFQG